MPPRKFVPFIRPVTVEKFVRKSPAIVCPTQRKLASAGATMSTRPLTVVSCAFAAGFPFESNVMLPFTLSTIADPVTLSSTTAPLVFFTVTLRVRFET